MAIDVGPEATLDRLEELCALAHDALLEGLQVATDLHEQLGYEPEADPHLFHNLVRRVAMEQLKKLNPRLLDRDNLGLAMSGLILPTDIDVVRIWHTADGNIPAPQSDRARAFVCQRSAWNPETLFSTAELDEPFPGMERNHLILQWTQNGTGLIRLALVRPIGIVGRPQRVATDWTRNLLADNAIASDPGVGQDPPDDDDDWPE